MTRTRRDILGMALVSPLLLSAARARRSVARELPGDGLAGLRDKFPQLKASEGERLIYLDSAGTTLRPTPVLDTVLGFYERRNANPGRGIHSLANRAMDEYEAARVEVARFINSSDPMEIIWTRGTTEAINLFASSWAVPRLKAGGEIVLTIAEHASCMLPLQIAAKKTGATIRYVDVDDEGRIRLDHLDALLSRRTKLVCFTHVSNVLGVVNPAEEICRRVKAVGARTLIDAAQSAPHFPIDVQKLGCDFAAFSSHKMLGPMGAGVLYARSEAMEEMDVYQSGANMAHGHGVNDWEYSKGALRFGAGTPSVADALGFGAAAKMLAGLDRVALWRREQELTRYALKQLRSVPGLRIVGPSSPEGRVSIFSFVIDGVETSRIVHECDKAGICIRGGDLASMPLLQRFKLQSAARASLYVYTLESEVDALKAVLRKVAKGSS